MTTTIEPYCADAHKAIIGSLRAEDRQEFEAWSDIILPKDLAQAELSFWANPQPRARAFIVRIDGRPVAFIGYAPSDNERDTAAVAAYGTPEWRRVVRKLTKWALFHMRWHMVASGYDYAQATVFKGHTTARRWLVWMGARRVAESGNFVVMKGEI